MADLDRFKRARQRQDFINDENSDVRSQSVISKIITRNKTAIELEENKLTNRERSRTKQGRNITTPLFAEELRVIEEAVSLISEKSDVSINSFIRETILAKCEKILGKESYKTIISDKKNVVKKK